LILLVLTAAISFGLGQRTDASVIGVILAVSIGLGFRNEYRAERAAQALHSQIMQRVAVVRDGQAATVNATALVVGDIVRIELGSIVPAYLRLLETTGLRCDESILTGESSAVVKTAEPADDMTSCAYMGTIVTPAVRSASWCPPAAAQCSAASRSASANGCPRPSSRSGCGGSPACWSRSPRCSPPASS
jgi:Mg2+-importing ATPase